MRRFIILRSDVRQVSNTWLVAAIRRDCRLNVFYPSSVPTIRPSLPPFEPEQRTKWRGRVSRFVGHPLTRIWTSLTLDFHQTNRNDTWTFLSKTTLSAVTHQPVRCSVVDGRTDRPISPDTMGCRCSSDSTGHGDFSGRSGVTPDEIPGLESV